MGGPNTVDRGHSAPHDRDARPALGAGAYASVGATETIRAGDAVSFVETP